jgi:hypothetical protein
LADFIIDAGKTEAHDRLFLPVDIDDKIRISFDKRRFGEDVHGISKTHDYLEDFPAELNLSIDGLIAVADSSTEHNIPGLHGDSSALRIQFPLENVRGIDFDGDVPSEFPVDLVFFRPPIAVHTIVGATPVQIHPVAGDEPGIDLFLLSEERFRFDLSSFQFFTPELPTNAAGARQVIPMLISHKGSLLFKAVMFYLRLSKKDSCRQTPIFYCRTITSQTTRSMAMNPFLSDICAGEISEGNSC